MGNPTDPYEPAVMKWIRYALMEGWNVYRCKCQECGHDWPRALVPGTIVGALKCSRCGLRKGQRYWQMHLSETD